MWGWLLRPLANRKERLALFSIALLSMLVWHFGLDWFFARFIPREAVSGPMVPGWAVLPVIIGVVTIEEILRLAPLALAVRFSKGNPAASLTVASVTAALFGAAHVAVGLPLWLALLCQGVEGFTLNLLYLKGGGLQGRRTHGFLYALAFHLVFDFYLLAPTLFFGGP